MKKGTINTIADYLYKRPGSRFSFVFAFFLLEERTGERSKTPEERMFGQEKSNTGRHVQVKEKAFWNSYL
jgi:hypothetical protein